LDGFPRNLEQAEMLDALTDLDLVLHISMREDALKVSFGPIRGPPLVFPPRLAQSVSPSKYQSGKKEKNCSVSWVFLLKKRKNRKNWFALLANGTGQYTRRHECCLDFGWVVVVSRVIIFARSH
jgi:hypothetical protein